MPEERTIIMDDTDLLDWLSAHPGVSQYRADEGIALTLYAAIGCGPDYRSALRALIANDAAKCQGIPNARDRKAMAST